jgi:hypothetical protein
MKKRIPLFAALLLAGAVAASAQTLSIADARSAPPGTVVTVEGSVTVPSASFTSSTFDQGFAIQDDTAGIYISTAFDSGLPATTGVNPFKIPWVKPGNCIRVSGFGGQFRTQYEVLPRFRGDIHKAH